MYMLLRGQAYCRIDYYRIKISVITHSEEIVTSNIRMSSSKDIGDYGAAFYSIERNSAIHSRVNADHACIENLRFQVAQQRRLRVV